MPELIAYALQSLIEMKKPELTGFLEENSFIICSSLRPFSDLSERENLQREFRICA